MPSKFTGRIHALERQISKKADIVQWDWWNDPYYQSLSPIAQTEMEVIMGKIQPHLPHNPIRAMESLTIEELDALEKFYLARFPELCGVTIEELREACR